MGDTDYDAVKDEVLVDRQPAMQSLDADSVESFSSSYKDFLSHSKTEREVIEYLVEQAETAGFTSLSDVTSVERGRRYYRVDHGKNLALLHFNGFDTVKGVASHVDSPCLHLKPYPLDEAQNVARFKTHYYGGVKKYQWLNIPLSLRGVAYTQDGDLVRFGDESDRPVFTIPDLLPHLASDQLEKEAKEVVTGEQLNPLVGTEHVDAEVEEQVKLRVAEILHDRYGLVEEDLVSAELSFVPAGEPRDAGFDSSMIAGYGHDDRSSAFASVQALFDAESSGTQMCLFYDKEEIGSTGTTGAQNQFWTSLVEDLIDLSSVDLRPTKVWERTEVISADVTNAIDPNFSDAYDESNACYLGYGVGVKKYGGHGGKYGTQDASAEFTTDLLHLLNDEDVAWQTGEFGKVDQGGGGTIAKFIAKNGAEVIDIGAPVLGMHAPYETVHKADLYSTYQAYTAFLEDG